MHSGNTRKVRHIDEWAVIHWYTKHWLTEQLSQKYSVILQNKNIKCSITLDVQSTANIPGFVIDLFTHDHEETDTRLIFHCLFVWHGRICYSSTLLKLDSKCHFFSALVVLKNCVILIYNNVFRFFHPKNQQFSADLVTFTEEILNGNLNFLCSVS